MPYYDLLKIYILDHKTLTSIKGGIESGSRLSQQDISLSMVPRTSSRLYENNDNTNRYNVISDVGTNNNNPFVNMYLDQNAPPVALPVAERSYSVQRNKSLSPPKNNPNEYTIGGVLSGKDDIDHYFINTLSVSVLARYLYSC